MRSFKDIYLQAIKRNMTFLLTANYEYEKKITLICSCMAIAGYLSLTALLLYAVDVFLF